MKMSSLRSWVARCLGADRGSQDRDPHQAEACLLLACESSFLGSSSNGVAATHASPATPGSPKAPLVVRIRDLEQAVVVSVAGVAGTDNLQPLEFALTHVLARRVTLAVLDCSALTLLSSLAMAMLIGLRRDLGHRQGCVKLACLSPWTQDALKTARLTELFEVHATVDEALATAGNSLAAVEAAASRNKSAT
jgi:anti-anti-sigma factor